MLNNDGEKTAYFANNDRLDFRMENIRYYANEMTNDYYVDQDIAYIFVKVRNENRYVVTLIDTDDLEKVKMIGYTWHYAQGIGEPYIVNTIVNKNGERKRVYLHRVVNDCPEDRVVDHINILL